MVNKREGWMEGGWVGGWVGGKEGETRREEGGTGTRAVGRVGGGEGWGSAKRASLQRHRGRLGEGGGRREGQEGRVGAAAGL